MSREEREKERENTRYESRMGDERGKISEREDRGKDKSTVKVVWKNVRKIRTREKQMELDDLMQNNDCDVCAINETGLNGNGNVEVCDRYTWIGTNRDWVEGKTGGVGFIIKRDLECKRISCDSKYICFVKIGKHDKRYEWLLGSLYMNCEGIRGEENVLKMQCVKDVVSNAKAEGLKIMVGI